MDKNPWQHWKSKAIKSMRTATEYVTSHRKSLLAGLRWTGLLLFYILFIPMMLAMPPVLAGFFVPRVDLIEESKENESSAQRINKLTAELTRLERKLQRLTPGNTYLVVNTTENRFSLYRNRELVREGLCSTGSMVILEGQDDQQWFFRTPRGEYRVQGKIVNPVWRKPDWAFVEDGLPVPSATHPSRYERGVLGDYALTLGDGYMIHGTLYQRFIGLPVTHGCIRMIDDDLEEVYKSLPVGAKVFIY